MWGFVEHHTKNDTLPSGGRWGPHEAQRLRGEKEEQGSGRMFFLSKKNGAKRTLLRRGDPSEIRTPDTLIKSHIRLCLYIFIIFYKSHKNVVFA